MAFGRKKKQEPEEVVEDAATNQEEKDLAVAYGNIDEANNDDVSLQESVPPPPPPAEEEESVGANEVADESVDEKKVVGQIKQKKLLLIASFLISFCVLLGLAIKYGQVRNQSSINESAALELDSTESASSPVVDDEETPAPTNATVAPTDAATEVATEVTTEAACIANEISIITTCDVDGAIVTFDICLIDDLSDQFWEWVSTPPGTPQVIANDWAWLRDGAVAEFPSRLADGAYEIGLFANGEQQLRQYPLLTSTAFTVDCSE